MSGESAMSYIQEALRKPDLKPKFPATEIQPRQIVSKIKERNRVGREFQRTRYPPLKEEPNRLRRRDPKRH
ncbi:hypothetical protein Trydic_g5332 [Trypoxylus dichotomus]